MTLSRHAIGYWKNGSTWVPANVVRQLDEPFVVRISGNGWIPLNVLLFAPNEGTATRVVMEALEICAAGQYANHIYINEHSAVKLLAGVYDGTLKLEAEPFQRGNIVKVNWASNDTI